MTEFTKRYEELCREHAALFASGPDEWLANRRVPSGARELYLRTRRLKREMLLALLELAGMKKSFLKGDIHSTQAIITAIVPTTNGGLAVGFTVSIFYDRMEFFATKRRRFERCTERPGWCVMRLRISRFRRYISPND